VQPAKPAAWTGRYRPHGLAQRGLCGSHRDQRVVLNTLRFFEQRDEDVAVCFGVTEAREAFTATRSWRAGSKPFYASKKR